jgi:glycosyltransferase involved in cell wall biosynthesis
VATRILYIHGIGRIGGAERDLLTMLHALDRDRWEPYVACPPETPLSERLANDGIPLRCLSLVAWRKWYAPLIRWRAVRSLRAVVTDLSPALIHVNDIWWVPQTIAAVRGISRLGRPIVAHVRQEIEPQKAGRYSLGSLDAVIAISKQVEQALIAGGVSAKAVRMIYSGLRFSNEAPPADKAALCRALGLSADAVLVGTVAHLFPRKGYDVMLRALPVIAREIPGVQYLVIGTGEPAYEQKLKSLAAALGVRDRVHFVGFQEDVTPLLSALSLYIHPARMEGFGIAVVEALAAGNAVVASRVGGLPEIVEHGRTGLLVNPDDSDELSAAVLSLLRDERRRKEMGERGAHAARERFDVKASVAAVERLYDDVLGAYQGRS